MTTLAPHNPHSSGPRADRRATTILALLAVAQLMLVLDVTVVNVALPHIGADLGLTAGAVPWVMTSYTLVFGGTMLLGGRLADLLGARRMTLVGLAVFTTSSLACALSGTAELLLAGRVSQGVGAALLSPAALASALSLFDEHGRAKALGVWSALAGVGSVLGVILGGVLTGTAGWRWVFAINLPIGVALLVALPLVLPAPSRAARPSTRGLDVPGALLVTGGTAAAIYGLTAVGAHGWGSWFTALPLVGGAALWALFAVVEARSAQPLLRPALLRRRPVLAGAFLMLIATGLLVGGFFVASFSLQHGRGYGALRVGLSFLPIALLIGVGAHLAGRLLVVHTAKVVASSGLLLAAAGLAAPAVWTSPAVLVAGMSVASFGIGATFVTAFTAALADVADHEGGLRSALVSTFHELGGAMGVAVLSSAVGTALVAPRATPDDFTRAFATAAVVAAVGATVALLVVPGVRRTAGSARPMH